MKLHDILAVTGLPGLYRMAANRNNGLILEDLSGGKRQFASARKHQFIPLESISIFTDNGDAMELGKVMDRMEEQYEDNPPPSPSAPNDKLFEYFADVVPSFDRDRVHAPDVKRVIKWFNHLKEHDLISDEEE